MISQSQLSGGAYQALRRVLDGHPLEPGQAHDLLGNDPHLISALGLVADELRQRQVGAEVTYVINRNINFTNVCIKQCGFCAFSRDYRTEQAYFLPPEEIDLRVSQAAALGATEVCIQAGLPPKMDGWLYVNLTRNLKSKFPQIHVHAFSPEEVLYGSVRAKVSIEEYLKALKQAGLDSLPGTSAEILVQQLRQEISPGRITVEQWTQVIKTAHTLGLRTTSTMMFGHAENQQHWLEHFQQLADIQRETGGFTEFVPLAFIHSEAPMWQRGSANVRAGAQEWESLAVHSLARILLGHLIPNIQTSWVKEGPARAQLLLTRGCNDLGGTLMNESISTAAGSVFGQRMTPAQLRELAYQIGRPAQQRRTDYTPIKQFSVGQHEEGEPQFEGQNFGSYHQLIDLKDHRYQHQQSTIPTDPRRAAV